MPEVYGPNCSYQSRAQPYLEAIAIGVRDSADCRAYLLRGTEYQLAYSDAASLWRQQWIERDPDDKMRCPFWSNYWYEPCKPCTCRINNSVSMEIDAMFFLQNAEGKRLALHIEMKRDREPLSLGQAEAYRPRAECYRDQRRPRKGLLAHDHFVTVLFCGVGSDMLKIGKFFDRLISHADARSIFPHYPT